MKRFLSIATVLFVCLTACAAKSPSPQLNFKKNSPEFSLEWKAGYGMKLEGLTCAIKIDGAWVNASEFPNIEWLTTKGDKNRISKAQEGEGRLRVYELVCSGRRPVKEFRLIIERASNRPYLVMSASAEAGTDYRLGGFRLLTSSDNGAIVPLPGSREYWTVFDENIRAPHIGLVYRPQQLETFKGKTHQGSWVSSIQNDKDNTTLAMAALGGELWPTNFHWSLPPEPEDALSLTVRSGSENELENILVRTGKTTVSDPVLVGFWNGPRPQEVLIEIGGIMGRHVREGKPPRRPEMGWSSWHSHHRELSEQIMLDTADYMKDNLADAGYKILQIDGGWWPYQGSYVVKDEFPHGMAWLSDEVHKRGLQFGLHISPFRVAPQDEFWRKRTDWIITPFGEKKIDPNDEEMITTIGAVYLDGSHPDVAPFLAKQFGDMARDYKVDFFKWDHHYGGLAEAERYDPTMTGLQAHNKVVRAIKAAIPEHIIVTRSMGFMLGAIECYDGMRISKDINSPGIVSQDEPYAKMTWGHTEGSIESVPGSKTKGLIRQARAVSQNFYVHNQIAVCDTDAGFASPAYTLEEARCHITLNALVGGLFFTGDRIESLPEERLELLKNKEVIDLWRHGKHAVPLDLFSGVDIPRLWKVDLPDRTVIGIFNWLDKPAIDTWSLEDLWLDGEKEYTMGDLWTGERLKLVNGKLVLSQQQHSVRLIEFKPIR